MQLGTNTVVNFQHMRAQDKFYVVDTLIGHNVLGACTLG